MLFLVQVLNYFLSGGTAELNRASSFFLQSFAQFVLVYNNIISPRLSCRHITAIITAVGQVGGSHDIRDDKQAINITLTKAMYDFWTCKIHVGETFEVLRLNSNKILIS